MVLPTVSCNVPRPIVLDTNVLIAGLWSREGASFQVLEGVRAGWLQPVLSVPLVLEYEMVLQRQAGELGLRAGDVDRILDSLCALGTHHQIHFLWRPSLRDPRDEMVLELAVAAGCPELVTFNVRDFEGAERLGVWPILPGALLQRVRQER